MRAPIDIIKHCPTFPPKPFPQSSELKERFEFMAKDKDNDGSINSAEYGPGKMQQDRFQRADKNHDGKLSYEEYKASKHILVPYQPDEFQPTFHKELGGAKKEFQTSSEEKPSLLKKLLPVLALTNPVTAPLGVFSLAKKLFS